MSHKVIQVPRFEGKYPPLTRPNEPPSMKDEPCYYPKEDIQADRTAGTVGKTVEQTPHGPYSE